MLRGLCLLLLLLPLGCARPTAPHTDGDPAVIPDQSSPSSLSVDRTEYVRGDTAQVTLTNGLKEQIGYNLCSVSRERWSGSEWKPVESSRICTMELRTLNPGQQAQSREPITAEWQTGRYRIVARVERMRSGTHLTLRTQSFEVRP